MTICLVNRRNGSFLHCITNIPTALLVRPLSSDLPMSPPRSIQDELFDSFQQLITLAQRRGAPFDAFILENSGVAEPRNIRDVFQEAATSADPARRSMVRHLALANLVTVVDASTFPRDFASRVPLATRPDLGDGGGTRAVVDLLVEQIECADVVVMNKASAHRLCSHPHGGTVRMRTSIAVERWTAPPALLVLCHPQPSSFFPTHTLPFSTSRSRICCRRARRRPWGPFCRPSTPWRGCSNPPGANWTRAL